MNTMKLKRQSGNIAGMILRYLILIGLCFIVLYPLFTKLCIAFMEKRDLYDSSVVYIPKNFTVANIRKSIAALDYWSTLLETVLTVGFLAVLQTASSMLAGYGFARFKFPFSKLLFGCVMVTLIISPQNIMVPLYLYFSEITFFGLFPNGLLNSMVPMTLLSATALGMRNGLFIYMFRQFFKGFPKELEESGQIDGAGTFRIFRSIIMPSSIAMTVTCFLFAFVWNWTETFYFSMFMGQNNLLQTQVLGLARYMSQMMAQTTSQPDVYLTSIYNNCGILLLIIPLVILYAFTQRFFVESFERSGIVG